MAYEIEEIRLSQQIFYYLLEHFELREEETSGLYRAYVENEQVQLLVKSQGDEAHSSIERYGDVIYLIPREENVFLGFSKAKLKEILCKSGGTDKDFYLSQFVILTLLSEFYDGQGASAKSRDYIRVGELQNCVTDRLKNGVENTSDEDEEKNGLAFRNMQEAYESLKSDERGSRARTTKEGFLHHIFMFLENQGLIEYVQEDEMIKTTKKLDNLMDWNLLNQNNYQRICKVLAGNGQGGGDE
ncbi:MAG: hypothetical protein K2L86_04535 [Lachnospiraceae bacterium]|nr:hypothetical protein [Lachnospiraceae bacterium]